MNKKCLAVGIILLFIGVAVAPSINSSVVQTSDDRVEVTTQACGMKGYDEITITLTKDQYQSLEAYLNDFRGRLSRTASTEEAASLFKETINMLASYGLLAPGWSTSHVQDQTLRSVLSPRFSSKAENASRNVACLVAGQINYTVSIYPLLNVVRYLGLLIGLVCLAPDLLLHFYLLHRDHLLFPEFIQKLWGVCERLMIIPELFQNAIQLGMILSDRGPQSVRNVVGVGSYELGGHYQASDGWLTSYGLFGKKEWNGTLYGNLPVPWIATAVGFTDIEYAFFPGMLGFTGIKLSTSDEPTQKFYLGCAVAVGLGPEPPEKS